jgi:hypothetical protein
MYNCIVSNAHIISNNGAGFLVSAMNNGTVLHIYLVAHAYDIYIAPNYGVEPDAAIVAHNHIPNNSGIGGNIAVVAKSGQYSFNW